MMKDEIWDPEFSKNIQTVTEPEKMSPNHLHILGNTAQYYELADVLFYVKNLVLEESPEFEFLLVYVSECCGYFYDNSMAGHMSCRKTFARASESCQYSKLKDFANRCIMTCPICYWYNYKNQLAGRFLTATNAKMQLQIVEIRLIGLYPTYEKNNCFCLVIVDYFSKWVESIPLKRAFTKTVMTVFFNNFISKCGGGGNASNLR